MSRRVGIGLLAAMFVAAAAFVAGGYRNATAAPVVRRLTVRVPDYPHGLAPLRLVLFSDIHVHGPDMPPERLSRIVDRIDGLHPDVAIAAGDFIGDNLVGRTYSVEQAIAPLHRLRARLGVFAVLGNNSLPRVIRFSQRSSTVSTAKP